LDDDRRQGHDHRPVHGFQACNYGIQFNHTGGRGVAPPDDAAYLGDGVNQPPATASILGSCRSGLHAATAKPTDFSSQKCAPPSKDRQFHQLRLFTTHEVQEFWR
jgi:hypothetical protein